MAALLIAKLIKLGDFRKPQARLAMRISRQTCQLAFDLM